MLYPLLRSGKCNSFSTLSYLRQLSCHRRPLKGFHSSRGRSSTPRLLWILLSPGCAYRNAQVDRNTNLQFETERTCAHHLRNGNRDIFDTFTTSEFLPLLHLKRFATSQFVRFFHFCSITESCSGAFTGKCYVKSQSIAFCQIEFNLLPIGRLRS